MKNYLSIVTFLASTCFFSLNIKAQISTTIVAQADNTIYQESPANSNGGGQHIFAGNIRTGNPRRALLKFDLAGAGIPAGTIFISASLTLNMNRSIASASNINLYKSLAGWGEGASVAGGQEGPGAPAAVNDATWLCSFSNGAGLSNTSWSAAGGDFVLSPSATTSVGPATGNYTWASAQLLADVQNWFDTPLTNNGWILIGDETNPTTANRFASRENITPANRPTLTVTYTTLPVSLISFTGEETKTGNKLFWKTAQEINNSFFGIETSLDAVNFSLIGKVNGNGNSTLMHSYSFMHTENIAGKHFYRLAQTDFNGRITYSSIISIDNKNSNYSIQIIPNPVSNKIILNGIIVRQACRYVIINEIGKTVLTGVLVNNSIEVNQLAGGNYFIKIYQKDNSFMQGKFLKQ